MPKEMGISFKVSPIFNRSMTFVNFINHHPLYFSILFNKSNANIKFKVETNNKLIKNNIIDVKFYRNLSLCKFCQTFFNLENQKDNMYDIKSKFAGVVKHFEKDIFQFQSEKLDLNVTNGKSNKPTNNYLLLLGWKLLGAEDDLSFFFIQRRGFNSITKTNIVRTATLQLATKRGLEFLDQYYNKSREITTIKEKKVDYLDFID